jgi:preprotein translocase subunit SecG
VSALITIIHVVICVVLIIAVLLQSGKAADLAGAFGGGGSQTAFGARGTATILSKVTTICSILFMFTSLGLWILSGKESGSAVRGTKPPATETQTPPAKAETKADQGQKQAATTVPQADEKKAPEKTAQQPVAPVKK